MLRVKALAPCDVEDDVEWFTFMQLTKIAPTDIALSMTRRGFAASHLVAIAWSLRRGVRARASVEPGKFVKLCGKLAPGDVVRPAFATAYGFVDLVVEGSTVSTRPASEARAMAQILPALMLHGGRAPVIAPRGLA